MTETAQVGLATTLGRLPAAADLETRTPIVPYEDHDDILDATRARPTP